MIIAFCLTFCLDTKSNKKVKSLLNSLTLKQKRLGHRNIPLGSNKKTTLFIAMNTLSLTKKSRASQTRYAQTEKARFIHYTLSIIKSQ